MDKKREYSENKCGDVEGKGQNVGLEVGGYRWASYWLERKEPAWVMYEIGESLYYTLETRVTLCVNCTGIKINYQFEL